ncbi:hypothetical protein JCM17844_17750 [Iodidimonas gelatinilytica]|uniref:Uncharacterized protein n=1 Tax=Iodidimonas gelatinilytica TaxID=1236966 RepID=A0A5A7MX84_9PROT|nr:hypothetical protein JCM17844_17750 [Iodidimonas gelatinilytica]GER00683.1 hypothetical protein JCM17845_13060 [Iodidimonas gelatinilytica]
MPPLDAPQIIIYPDLARLACAWGINKGLIIKEIADAYHKKFNKLSRDKVPMA